MGRHCFNDWMNCGILISKINIAWILCLHDLCFIRITYDNKIMYEQFSVWSLIKNVIWTYSLWAIYILRLCAQTCTPNRHALKQKDSLRPAIKRNLKALGDFGQTRKKPQICRCSLLLCHHCNRNQSLSCRVQVIFFSESLSKPFQ